MIVHQNHNQLLDITNVAGYTDQFEDIWKGSTTDPSQIVVALLPGFITYAGWCVFIYLPIE